MSEMTKEKKRMIVLAVLVVAFSFVFYVIDAYLYAKAFAPVNWNGGIDVLPHWWVVMPILTGLFAFGIGLGAWYGDFRTSREDIYGTLLLIATPFILIWSGLLDIHSAALIDYFLSGVYARCWDLWWTWDWWWLDDPFKLGFGWSLPSWIKAFVKSPVLWFWYVVAGAVIGACLVIALWIAYWKYA